MSTIWGYLDKTVQGMEQCFQNDKSIVLLLAGLLILWLQEKKRVDERGNRLLVYSLIMAVILLCPLTAMAVVIYQTAFYDYEWAWSMVPVLVTIAYTGVLLYEEWAEGLPKGKKIGVILLAMVVLFLCTNQGVLPQAEEKEAKARSQTAEIVECLELYGGEHKQILWGPREIMQEVRRSTGEILLIYGKDMWDAKSGAYDYEAYDEKFIQAYEWMEQVTVLSQEATDKEAFDRLCREYQLEEEAGVHVKNMTEAKSTVLVLPEMAAEYLDIELKRIFEESGLKVEKTNTEQYTLYLLK